MLWEIITVIFFILSLHVYVSIATSAGRQTDEDSRWKMKVRKMSPEELENDASIQSLPSRQQKHLESSLKESLEKAGVDPNSTSISTNTDLKQGSFFFKQYRE